MYLNRQRRETIDRVEYQFERLSAQTVCHFNGEREQRDTARTTYSQSNERTHSQEKSNSFFLWEEKKEEKLIVSILWYIKEKRIHYIMKMESVFLSYYIYHFTHIHTEKEETHLITVLAQRNTRRMTLRVRATTTGRRDREKKKQLIDVCSLLPNCKLCNTLCFGRHNIINTIFIIQYYSHLHCSFLFLQLSYLIYSP